MDTVIAGARLTSFAWHEPAAVQAARRADRLGRRTRLGRWAWVPVPIGMRGPEAARSAEVVVGVGGYVAVPAYLAARRQRLPIVVHEANAWPGVANRLAARMTTHAFKAAPSVRLAHATPIGFPLRPGITGLDRPALRDAARQRFGSSTTPTSTRP